MTINALVRTCACLGLLTTTAMPSFAASSVTDGFVANIRLRAVFVAKASLLAADRAGSQTVRDLAASQASHQVDVLDTLEGMPTSAPHDAVADLGQPTTGRSVGKDAIIDLTAYASPAGLGALLPAATVSLERLASLKGEAFDQFYGSVVRGVLGDQAAFYQAYVRTGDDDAIRALAARELSTTGASIAALR